MIITEVMKKKDWEIVNKLNEFSTPSLKKEGFIHCSNIEQVCAVANKHYTKTRDLLLLCIDTDILESEVVWEDLKNKGEEFPHVYGTINTSSIVKVFPMYLNNLNEFELTDEIKHYFKIN